MAINEAYAATKWVADNGAQINVDGKRLAVAGNSVGGNSVGCNMAAVVALRAKAKGDPALRAQVLQRQEFYASPLLATTEQLKGLPPTLVQSAEKDVLRDEGEAYARKLDAAGVTVVATRCNGMIHDFGLLNVLSVVPTTRAALHRASEELKARLR